MMTRKNIIIAVSVALLIAGWFVYADTAAVDSDDNALVLMPNEAGYYDITIDELKARIDDKYDDNFIIVDIRDDVSFDAGHILGAINIPLNELGYRVFSLDKTKDIIVYCFTGVTSEVACQILVNAGFKDVYNVIGGIKAWDYAIETSDGRINI